MLAGAAVSTTLALGGMRAATYVQAFQFVLKLVLFIVPALWLVLQVGPDTRRDALDPGRVHPVRRRPPRCSSGWTPRSPSTEPTRVSVAGGPTQLLAPGRHTADAGSTWVFDAGAAVPAARRRPAGRPGLGPAAARPVGRRPPAAGHLVGAGGHGAGHDGPAAHPDPLPHQPRRPRRPAHGRHHGRPARRVLPVPRRVRAARRGAAARAVPVRGHRHRGGGAAGQGRPGPGGVAVHRAAHRGGVRRLPGHLARAAAGGVRGAVARPGARHRCAGCGSPRWPPPAAIVLLALPAAQHRRRGAGHLGVRGRRVHLLPAAGAGHLVAAADRPRARWWAWSSACSPRPA